MTPLRFKRHRSPPLAVRHSFWLYAGFALNLHDVKVTLIERNLDLSCEIIRRWFIKFGASIAANLRCQQPAFSNCGHLDEMVVAIRRWRFWLWRAVGIEGEGLDAPVQPRRDAKAAIKLVKKPIKQHGFAPSRIVTDTLRSCLSAISRLGLATDHDTVLRPSNRAETSH